MRPITLNTGYMLSDFDALLATRQFSYFEAYTFRLTSGRALAYTNAPKSFTVPPVDGLNVLKTYVANDVLVDGVKFKITSGANAQPGDPGVSIEIDEQSITLTPNANPDSPSLIDGVPFIPAVGMGALDKAIIQRDRWFFPEPGAPAVAGMPMFYGYVSVDSRTRTQVIGKVRSALVLLNIMMPRNLYQPNCIYTVYSGPCGAIKSAFANAATVGASPSRLFLPWTGATAQFALGEVTFTDGANINVVRSIRAADTSGLYLASPLPYVPASGDHFTAYPGCDRQRDSGCTYFARTGAFRAYTFTPEAQMAV